MNITVVHPPTSMPVSLTQVKQHLRIDNDAEDVVLTGMISSAIDYCEVTLRQNLIERTLRQDFSRKDCVPGIFLTGSPVREVVEMRGLSLSGQTVVIPSSDYTVSFHDGQAHICIKDIIAPAVIAQGVSIDYLSGFGQTGAEIPGNISRAIMMLVAHWYEFRGASHRDEPAENLPSGIETLLAPHRRIAL